MPESITDRGILSKIQSDHMDPSSLLKGAPTGLQQRPESTSLQTCGLTLEQVGMQTQNVNGLRPSKSDISSLIPSATDHVDLNSAEKVPQQLSTITSLPTRDSTLEQDGMSKQSLAKPMLSKSDISSPIPSATDHVDLNSAEKVPQQLSTITSLPTRGSTLEQDGMLQQTLAKPKLSKSDVPSKSDFDAIDPTLFNIASKALKKWPTINSLPTCGSTLEQEGMSQQPLAKPMLSKSDDPFDPAPFNRSSKGATITLTEPKLFNLYVDGRVDGKTLKLIIDHLKGRTDCSNRKVQSQLLSIQTMINTALNSQLSTSIISIDDTGSISYQLEKLADSLPESKIKEACSILGQNLKSDWATQKNQELNNIKIKQQKCLNSPGESEAKSFSFGFSARLIWLTKILVTIQQKFSKATDDEALFFVESSTSFKGKASVGTPTEFTDQAGVKIAASAQGSYTRTSFKEDSSFEHYIKRTGYKHNWANRRQLVDVSKITKLFDVFRSHLPFNLGSELKHLKSERQQATNSQHRLADLLKTECNIKVNVNAVPMERIKPLMGYYNTWAGEVKIEANASAIALGAGLSGQVEMTNIYEFVPSQFYDVIKKNATKLEELPANLTRHAKEIVPDFSGSNAATKGLEGLLQDLDNYYQTVETYDYFKSAKNKDPDAIKQFNQYRINKHTIENRWGAIGRHQFVQFACASHAYLANKAMNEDLQSQALTTEQQDSKMELIANVAMKTQAPPITHSKKRLDKIATFTQQIYLKTIGKKIGINVSAGPISAQLDVLKRERIHPSRTRAGTYVDLTITWTVSGSTQDLIDKASITKKITDAATKEGVQLPQGFEFSPDLSGELSGTVLIRLFKPNYAKKSDFTGDKGYRRQFIRDLRSISVGGGLGVNAMIAPGVSGGANVAVNYSKTKMLGEEIGTEDLTYTMTRYNRFYRNANEKPHNKEWLAFQSEQKGQYRIMFSHLGDKTHNIHKEAQHFLNELVSKAPDEVNKGKAQNLSDRFKQAMSDYQVARMRYYQAHQISDDQIDQMSNDQIDQITEGKFNIAKQCFNEFLEQQIEPWWADHTSSWTDLPFAQAADSGLDRGTQIKKWLGLHERVKEQAAIVINKNNKNSERG